MTVVEVFLQNSYPSAQAHRSKFGNYATWKFTEKFPLILINISFQGYFLILGENVLIYVSLASVRDLSVAQMLWKMFNSRQTTLNILNISATQLKSGLEEVFPSFSFLSNDNNVKVRCNTELTSFHRQ